VLLNAILVFVFLNRLVIFRKIFVFMLKCYLFTWSPDDVIVKMINSGY
jgi:hypothetical protein